MGVSAISLGRSYNFLLGNLHLYLKPEDPRGVVLDAYIIEEIKRREEKRRREEEKHRPRIHIDPDGPDPRRKEEEVSEPPPDENDGSIRIDIDDPTIPAEPRGWGRASSANREPGDRRSLFLARSVVEGLHP